MDPQAAIKSAQPIIRIAIINHGTLHMHSSAFSSLESQASPAVELREEPITAYSYESDQSKTCNEDVVVDHVRQLMWSRRPISTERLTFEKAEAACKACRLEGHSDWRLPTREELVSLVDYNRFNPAIDTELFPDTPPNYFWSSSPDASDPDYAWIVNFNNGNVNLNNRHNNAFVRAVRSVPASEYQGARAESVPLRALYEAWQRARRKKRPSHDQVRFESQWIDGLLDLQRRIRLGTWSPSCSTCFVATRPKAREIHAPAFADRIVHHWIVPQLEALYEPTFIADSYSNRKGKGTLAAVKRLQAFVRQVHSGQGGGHYLQLDIRNFFNAIHRPTLYRMLKQRVATTLPIASQRVVHALLRHGIRQTGVRHRSSASERAAVPAHKRLEQAAPGCGIPIGNLSSQFFANVYLDALDQFVKHTLKAKRYLRYVDDFVLVHHDRSQLLEWQQQITAFLRDRLRLNLKDDIRLRPLTDGIDFLGYVIRPTHTLVRRRVVAHANQVITDWARQHVDGQHLKATPAGLRSITATWRSYEGHLQHASTHRLRQALHRRFPWLHSATVNSTFHHRTEHREIAIAWSPSQH